MEVRDPAEGVRRRETRARAFTVLHDPGRPPGTTSICGRRDCVRTLPGCDAPTGLAGATHCGDSRHTRLENPVTPRVGAPPTSLARVLQRPLPTAVRRGIASQARLQ